MSGAMVLVAGAVGAACHSAPTERICPAFPTVLLQTVPPFDSIPIGDTTRFRLPASALAQKPAPVIQWSTGSASVATISADSGLAHAHALGTTDISGTDQNTIGSCYAATYHGSLRVRPLNSLPPDTLPHSVSDSVLALSVSNTALYANGSITVTFVVTNPLSDTLHWGNGEPSCRLSVRGYDQSGNLAAQGPYCNQLIAPFAVLPPHATYTTHLTWTASADQNVDGPTAPLAAGVYDLEPKVDALDFKWVGKRVRVQVIRP